MLLRLLADAAKRLQASLCTFAATKPWTSPIDSRLLYVREMHRAAASQQVCIVLAAVGTFGFGEL